MMHVKRFHAVATVATLEELAEKLLGENAPSGWTLCTGFFVPLQDNRGIALLNDATSEDGAQEYTVLLTARGLDFGTEIESLTVSWMEKDRLLKVLHELVEPIMQGNNPEYTYGTYHGVMEWNHEPCRFCA